MSDKTVEVEGLDSDNATLLLAAAEELGLDASVVQTTTRGVFVVPAKVADKAGLGESKPRTATKKAAAKKTAAAPDKNKE